METKVSQVGFALKRISSEQFAIIEKVYIPDREIKVNTKIKFASNDENKMITCFTTFTFECEQQPFLLIEAGCHFKIHDDSWNNMFNIERKKLNVPKGLLTHFAVLSVGTTRGILHSKTEGTEFNKFVLPTINVAEMFKEDVEFDFSEDKK